MDYNTTEEVVENELFDTPPQHDSNHYQPEIIIMNYDMNGIGRWEGVHMYIYTCDGKHYTMLSVCVVKILKVNDMEFHSFLA